MRLRTIVAAAAGVGALLSTAVAETASAATINAHVASAFQQVPKVAPRLPVRVVMGGGVSKPGGIHPFHVSETDHVWANAYQWGANVTIDYGLSGAVTGCSDGAVIYGPLQGAGYWQFGGNCYGHGYFSWYNFYDG